MLRRLVTVALIAVATLLADPLPGKVVIVYPRGSAPYEPAVAGVRELLEGARASYEAVAYEEGRPAETITRVLRSNPRLVIAVGGEASGSLEGRAGQTPVLATMTLRPGHGINPPPGVYLNVSPADVLAQVRQIFPGRARVGVLLNPAVGQTSASVKAECERSGFTAEIVECTAPADLLRKFRRLKEAGVDFVLCFPDSTLYNGATVKPLVLASLELRLPIIGFSASFVRAGAAVGVYPELRSLGLQAGEMALRYLAGGGLAAENPKTLEVAVNQRVLRLIGLGLPANNRHEVVLIR